MSYGWVVFGTIMQLTLSLFLFMLAAFAGGGVANGRNFSDGLMKIIDLSIYLLPATAIFAAGIVIYQYNNDGSVYNYWWYSFPILSAIIYTRFVTSL